MKKMHPFVMKSHCCLLGFLLLFMAACAHRGALEGASVERISKEELESLLGDSGTTIVDVRSKRDWEGSDKKIPGAVRQSPSKDDLSWAEALDREKRIVLYCA